MPPRTSTLHNNPEHIYKTDTDDLSGPSVRPNFPAASTRQPNPARSPQARRRPAQEPLPLTHQAQSASSSPVRLPDLLPALQTSNEISLDTVTDNALAEGALGGAAQAIGGPFDKQGAIGKQFTTGGSIGGSVQEHLGKGENNTYTKQ